MFSYEELLSQIGTEAGRHVPANLPQLVRETELELWNELWFCGTRTTLQVTASAGAKSVTLPAGWDKILTINSALAEKRLLRHSSFSQMQRLWSERDTGKIVAFCWEQGATLYVAYVPDADTVIELDIYERDDFLTGGDTDKFFLKEGFSVLKYAVLYKHVFNPEKWELWKRNFFEALNRLYAAKMTKGMSYRAGTPIWRGEIE